MHAFIAGTGSYLPEKRVNNRELFARTDNFDLERAKLSLEKKGNFLAKSKDDEIFDLWVKQVSGICERPFLTPGEFPENFEIEHMAEKAARQAMDEAGLEPAQIDCIVFATYTAETIIPNPACTLSHLLGIKNSCGITINTACSGFLDALGDAWLRIKSGEYKNILVAASEYMSNKIDFSDPATSILFADGAGACVVRAGNPGIHAYYSEQDYSNEHIRMDYGSPIKMGGGPLVQKRAVNAMYKAAEKALEKCGRTIEQIDFIIPHQANLRILEALELKMKLGENVMIKAMKKIGNIAGATVPVALDLFRRKNLDNQGYRPGSRLILLSVGGGYTYSACVLDL